MEIILIYSFNLMRAFQNSITRFLHRQQFPDVATIFAMGFALLITAVSCSSSKTERPHLAKCTRVYFDNPKQENPYKEYAKRGSISLVNLLGHFKDWKKERVSINEYQSGDLEECQVNFYVGTFYDNKAPKSFYDDLEKTQSRVVWIGYNIWGMPPSVLEHRFGLEYKGIESFSPNDFDSDGLNAFYRHFSYKGEDFNKSAVKTKDPKQPISAAVELVKVQLSKKKETKVYSWARYSGSKEKRPRLPYITQHGNYWYVADIPFSYIHTSDRYLIFADILFDVLNEKPVWGGKKPAFIRIEDVHPQIKSSQIEGYANFFSERKVPFAISTIPVYQNIDKKTKALIRVEAKERPNWIKSMKYAQSKGASIIFHGYTHQLDSYPNPSGLSGWDYEFWDINKKKPVAQDSVPFVLGRLEKGYKILEDNFGGADAWITPHYDASPLNNLIFGRVFDWVIGRVRYPSSFHVVQGEVMSREYTFFNSGSRGKEDRERFLKDVKVIVPEEAMPYYVGEFFPYEIYHDLYGQSVIPENLHFVRLKDPAQALKEKRVLMRKLSKLRDTWASFYIHPWIMDVDPKGVSRELDLYIKELRALGYEFVDLKSWSKKHRL